MYLGELDDWPPVPAGLAVRAGEAGAVILRCDFVPNTPLVSAHVEVSIEHDRRVFNAVYWHPSPGVLQRIAATLNAASGVSLWATPWLELVDRR